ncbi:MAG: hypothetical protein PVK01_03230 [Flavobacteriaceae bacterium]|jgi:hypothetical protein
MKLKPYFLLSAILFITTSLWSQKGMSRFEELKAWKLNYIIENTSLTSEEIEVYKCIFEEYENSYHNEIWMKVQEIRKGIRQSLDTISTFSAASYINDFDSYEIKGLQMKHQRNEKLLKKIRPKQVLLILYQEKRFDKELLNRIKNKPKKEQ